MVKSSPERNDLDLKHVNDEGPNDTYAVMHSGVVPVTSSKIVYQYIENLKCGVPGTRYQVPIVRRSKSTIPVPCRQSVPGTRYANPLLSC